MALPYPTLADVKVNASEYPTDQVLNRGTSRLLANDLDLYEDLMTVSGDVDDLEVVVDAIKTINRHYLTTGQYAQLPEITSVNDKDVVAIIVNSTKVDDVYINPYGVQKIMDHAGPLQASDSTEDYRSLMLMACLTTLSWIMVGGINTWEEVSSIPIAIDETTVTIT